MCMQSVNSSMGFQEESANNRLNISEGKTQVPTINVIIVVILNTFSIIAITIDVIAHSRQT